jgi:hypothetical protein
MSVLSAHDVLYDIVPRVSLYYAYSLFWVPAPVPGVDAILEAPPHHSPLHCNAAPITECQFPSRTVDADLG